MDQSASRVAIEFIQSACHLFEMTYQTKSLAFENFYVIDYRTSSYETNNFQFEYFVLDISNTGQTLFEHHAIGKSCIYNIFHDIGKRSDIQIQMSDFKKQVDYWYTAPVQCYLLPSDSVINTTVDAYLIKSQADIDFVNASLGTSERPMPKSGFDDPYIQRFYVVQDDKAVAWTQMITRFAPRSVYVGEMFTLPEYRKRGIAKSLLSRIHTEARQLGCEQVILVPSQMAKDFYTQYGYKTSVEFSIFHLA